MSHYKPPAALEHKIPQAPLPSTLSQKISHALPLPFHLGLTSARVSVSLVASLVAHCLDGPLKPSWSLSTTIVHSLMKSVMASHAPQGKHSFDLVRFFTSKLALPGFLFDATFSPDQFTIETPLFLHEQVVKALDVKVTLSDAAHRVLCGEWVNPPMQDKQGVVLYLHGGAHIFLSPGTHRALTSNIAKQTGLPVFALDYRLCPEALFPGAVEDALACYLALCGLSHEGFSPRLGSGRTFDPTRVVIMGDSSGGCLTLQLLSVLRGLGLPMPAGICLLSPFVDHGS